MKPALRVLGILAFVAGGLVLMAAGCATTCVHSPYGLGKVSVVWALGLALIFLGVWARRAGRSEEPDYEEPFQ